uniref:Uncharacterized protein n=1 Tax=Moniliophthora roreri TaxID=221103 RepID=A0A0W0GET0_MONRR
MVTTSAKKLDLEGKVDDNLVKSCCLKANVWPNQQLVSVPLPNLPPYVHFPPLNLFNTIAIEIHFYVPDMGFKFMDWFEKNLKGKLNRRKKSPSDTLPATPTSTSTNAMATLEEATKLPSAQPVASQSTSSSAVKDVTVPTINPHLPSGVTNNEAVSGSVKAVSRVAAAAGEAVPVVGPIIKGTINAILEVLTVIEQVTGNKDEILMMSWTLNNLIHRIENKSVTMADQDWDQLHKDLSSLCDLLNKLEGSWNTNFAPEKVSQMLQMIHNGMISALLQYSALSIMEMRHTMSKSPIAVTATIIDAANRRFSFPAGMLLHRESLHCHLENLFGFPEEQPNIISATLLEFVKQGQYSLSVVDKNGQVVMLGSGEKQWARLEPGTEITMNAILSQEKEDDVSFGYRCPVCDTWNGIQDSGVNATRDCSNPDCLGRFQAFEEGDSSGVGKSDRQSKIMDTTILKNFHIIQATDWSTPGSDSQKVACFYRVPQQIHADCHGLDSDSQNEVCVSTVSQ